MYPNVKQFDTPELRRHRALELATLAQPRPSRRRRFHLTARRPCPGGLLKGSSTDHGKVARPSATAGTRLV